MGWLYSTGVVLTRRVQQYYYQAGVLKVLWVSAANPDRRLEYNVQYLFAIGALVEDVAFVVKPYTHINNIIVAMSDNQLSGLLASLEHSKGEYALVIKDQWIQLISNTSHDPLAINPLLTKTAEFIMKLHEIQDLQALSEVEDILTRILFISINSRFLYGLEAIRHIFNLKAEYYEYNSLDRNLDFPIGRAHPIPQFVPNINQECDALKPYVTCTSPSVWTRCVVLGINENGVASIKFANQNDITSIRTLFAPLNTRCKDHDWRMDLKIGDLVDAQYSNFIWYLSTVTEVLLDKSVREVKIAFRYYDQKGDKKDEHGSYFGWGSTGDQILNVMSPRVQFPHKMHKNLDYLSPVIQNQPVLDDSYDIVYEQDFKRQPFFSILRTNFCKSQTLMTLFDLFMSQNGLAILLELMDNNQSPEKIYHLLYVLANVYHFVPRMAVEALSSPIITGLKRWVTSNSKIMNARMLELVFPVLYLISKRVMTISETNDSIYAFKKELLLVFLPMNLDKQLIALKLLYDLIRPVVPFTPQKKQQFIRFLLQLGIFQRVYQHNNTHDQVLARTRQFLKFYFDNNIMTPKELDHLWRVVPVSDFRGRAILQKLLGDVSPEMHHQHVEFLVANILQIKESELTLGNLGLLKVLKDKVYNKEYIMGMLDYVWNIIIVKSDNVKLAIESQAELVFKAFIGSLKDGETKFRLLKSMVHRLKGGAKTIQKELGIVSDYLKTFKENRETDDNPQTPVTIRQVIAYLKQQEGIYPTILDLIGASRSPEVTRNLIKLLSYLLSFDTSTDSGEILKDLYQKLQDKELVLNIAKQFACSSTSFSSWFLQDTSIAQSIPKLSPNGLEAIKQLFIQFNVHNKNIVLRFGKPTGQAAETQVGRRFVYVLVEPCKLLGVELLWELLKTVEEDQTCDNLIEFMVGLQVQLDEALTSKTIAIRKQFLKRVILDIECLTGSEFSTKIQRQINVNIKIIKEFMVETQKRGLFKLMPHIESVEGEYYNLKIINSLTNSNAPKEVTVTINENASFWRLIQTVGQLMGQNPLAIALHKSPNTFRLQNKQFGTALSSMHIWRDQTLTVVRAEVEEVPRTALLNDGGNDVSPQFGRVISEWFHSYEQADGLMSLQGFHKFSNDFSRKAVEQKQSLDVVVRYDSDKDMNLTLPQFKRHFYDLTISSLDGMWRFLNLNRYVNTLRKSTQPVQLLSIEYLPRFILADEFVFKVLFNIFSLPSFQPVYTNVYSFVTSLPTNQRIEKTLESDFKILDKSSNSFELNYLLDILLKNIRHFQSQYFIFGVNGGIALLSQKVGNYNLEGNESSALKDSDQMILQKLLGAINLYVLVDNAENDTLVSVFGQTFVQMNLIQFDDMLTKKATKASEELLDRSRTFKQMKIEVDYESISKIANSLLKRIIGVNGKDLGKSLLAQVCKLSYSSCFHRKASLDVLFLGLLSESLLVRRVVTSSLYLFSLHSEQTRKVVTQYLLNNIPLENTYLCNEYFDLLSLLIHKFIQEAESFLDVETIVEDLIKNILTMKTQEKRNVFMSQNRVLKGQLSVVNTILQKRPEICLKLSNYLKPLMRKCLFFYTPAERVQALIVPKQCLQNNQQEEFFEDYPNCKSAGNRKQLLDIVAVLYKASPPDDFLASFILPILQQLPGKTRQPSTKSYSVGLYNFGSTCYMSAMLQMLNIVKPFRNGLLMADNPASKVGQEVQRLFSFLYFSERQDYVPEGLLKAFNPPINPNIQQDTTEFLNFFFNHLEEDLKSTSYRNLLDCLFQGTTIVQMICHSCGKKKQISESFFCYQVGVKDRNNLDQALEHNHQGEVISDWLCQFCNSKSDMTKRTLLKDIPNIMFIHLQRIVFNFDLYINTKIHSHLDFPTQLNIEPYIKQGIELRESVGLEYLKKLTEDQVEKKLFQERCLHGQHKDNYLLDLIGVIVHSGSADVGHYYTIVRNEVQNKKQLGSQKNSLQAKLKEFSMLGASEYNWLKLDDTKTSFCTKSMMMSECSGGTILSGWEFGGTEQSKNAYVLVYQKRLKDPIQLAIEQNPTQDQKEIETKMVDYNDFKTHNLEKYYKQVWLDNHNLMLETHLVGDNYGKSFIKFIQNVLEVSQENCRPEIISQVVFKMIPHISEAGKIMDILETTKPNFETFGKYLTDTKRVTEMLFNNDRTTRVAFGKYVSVVIVSCLRHHSEQSHQPVYQLLNYLLSILNTQAARNWIKAESYFYIFFRLLEESNSIDQLYFFLVSKQLIAQFVDFVLQKQSPVKLCQKKHQIGNKHANVQFDYGVQAIYFLLQRSFLFINKNVEVELINERQKFHLSDNECIVLSCMNFYAKMLWNKQGVKELSYIIHRLAIENLGFTKAITRLLLTILAQSKGSDVSIGVAECVQQLLIIKDNLLYQRAEFLLGYGTRSPVKPDNRIHSLQEEIHTFNSTLENLFPVESILYYCYANRTNFPLLILQLLQIVVKSCCTHPTLLQFLAKQPSVTYLHIRYYQWIRHYALNAKGFLALDKVNVTILDAQIRDILGCIDVIDSFAKSSNVPNMLIVGSVIEQRTQYKKAIDGYPNLYQQLAEFQVYGLNSSPSETPYTNQALDGLIEGFKLKDTNISPDSNILYIMRPSNTTTITKKNQKIQREFAIQEQTNIQPFFSDMDDVDVKREQTKDNRAPLKEQPNNHVIKEESKDMEVESLQHTQEAVVNVDGILTSEYIRQLVIQNGSQQDIWAIVEFTNMDPIQTNCILPSRCSTRIRSGYKEVALVMSKYDHNLPWYAFSYKVTIQGGNNYSERKQRVECFKIYGQVPEGLVELQRPVVGAIAPVQMMVEPKMEYQQNMSTTQRPCPTCTFLNIPIVLECQACGSPLM